MRRLKNLLQQTVAMAAVSTLETRKALMASAAELRWRSVCIAAARQLLAVTGRGVARQGSSGRWPTDQGLKLTSPSAVLQPLQQCPERMHGAACQHDGGGQVWRPG